MHFKRLALLASCAAASLAPRQTGLAAVASCASKLSALMESFPTPGPRLEEAINSGQAVSINECNLSVPASLSSEYQEFRSSLLSVANQGYQELKTCPGYSANLSNLPTQCFSEMSMTAPQTHQAAAAPTHSTSSTTTGASSGKTAGAASSSTQRARAPRETGMALAAMAVAGVALAL
ncbi:hypothetical protein E4U19_005800 [Claviceps sp. Clav32 group G5]|nr:hypothetical protein E4U40_004827 [Claviceps sp. LM458 group G5]KAG6039479.1 hypothetical protein E4U19_005800 [Claviceps sp. Clav32 group G5]KAG6043361.1 hypothetical protein E4U39_004649 [Claviceps sp. Clav50 group G5]